MRGLSQFLLIGLLVLATGSRLTLLASSSTFLDYQNYNRGYCPDCQCAPCSCQATGGTCPRCSANQVKGTCPNCPSQEGTEEGQPPPPPPAHPKKCKTVNPCSPPATTAATECGVNLWLIGIGIAVLVIAATFIVSSNNGHHSTTLPP